jgi:hypothetical protein
MVVIPLPASEPRQAYGVYLRSGIVNAHGLRGWIGQSSQVCSPNPSPWVVRRVIWIETFNARLTRAIFEGFCFR